MLQTTCRPSPLAQNNGDRSQQCHSVTVKRRRHVAGPQTFEQHSYQQHNWHALTFGLSMPAAGLAIECHQRLLLRYLQKAGATTKVFVILCMSNGHCGDAQARGGVGNREGTAQAIKLQVQFSSLNKALFRSSQPNSCVTLQGLGKTVNTALSSSPCSRKHSIVLAGATGVPAIQQPADLAKCCPWNGRTSQH